MTALMNTPGFATALVALIVALTAYVQQRITRAQQGAHIEALQKQADQPAPVTSTIVAVPAATGSGATPLAAPVWNQLNDPLPDGQQDPYATTDCGEESVAMVVAACGGPELPAGSFRMLLGGPNRPGLTTAAALCYLLQLFQVRCHPRQCDPDSAWAEWGHSYAAGYLVIALGYWVTPGYGHWVVIRECTDAGIVFNDPWGGLARSMDKANAQKLFLGWYVHVDQAVSAPAPSPVSST